MERFCIARLPKIGDEHLGPNYQVADPTPTPVTNTVPIATLLWNKTSLTYAIGQLSADISLDRPETVAINLAIEKWHVECGLNFTQVKITENPDILIEFVDPTTDPVISTDPTNIMGYAGFPTTSLQGHVRLNNSLNWGWSSVNFSWNINNTLTHEFGHAIGMEHTPECGTCIMFPVYNGSVMLGTDDIAQVTTAYGVRTWTNGWYNRIKTAISNWIGQTSP